MALWDRILGGGALGAKIGGGAGTAAGPVGSVGGTVGGAVLGAGIAAAPELIGLAGRGIGKFQEWRDPRGFEQQKILKQHNITPEQYDLRAQELDRGLQTLTRQQNLYTPAQANMGQGGNFAARLPANVGQQQGAARPGSLQDILQNIYGGIGAGYNEDLADIGSRSRSVRNPVGRTSGEFGMRSEALRGRLVGAQQTGMDLLSDFANRNAMADLEAQGLELQRGAAGQRLRGFMGDVRRQDKQNMQNQYIGQQGYNINQAGLQNRLQGERYNQAARGYRLGQQPVYNTQQAPQGV